MKACKFCGTQVQNGVQHCPSCGSSVFLHVCENCGSRFDSSFCPNCGVKAGQGKKICPECKTAYFSNACPNCGYTPSRKKVVQEVVHKHVYVEPEPVRQPAPAPPVKKKGKGCGCLTWILILVVISAIFGGSNSRKATKTATDSRSKTTSSVTLDPNATAVPTSTPEPAVAAAQEKVDRYFEGAGEEEIAAAREADSILYQPDAVRQGKVLLVHRTWAEDRGLVGKSKNEPDYIGALGYAAVNSGEKLENDEGFGKTPWKIPVYRKDKQFWEEAGTVDHKTEIAVIGMELEMPSRAYSTSCCTGYLHVIRMDTGEDCWLKVENFVTGAYWEKDLSSAREKGYCLAEFRQKSDFYPVTRSNGKAELEDGTRVLIPMKSKFYTSGPDETNSPVPGFVFMEYVNASGIVTLFFNPEDLTLIY